MRALETWSDGALHRRSVSSKKVKETDDDDETDAS